MSLAMSPPKAAADRRIAETKVGKKPLPGQNGTKRHRQEYGAALVCVRYRTDANRRRYTTVEIVVMNAHCQVEPLPANSTMATSWPSVSNAMRPSCALASNRPAPNWIANNVFGACRMGWPPSSGCKPGSSDSESKVPRYGNAHAYIR